MPRAAARAAALAAAAAGPGAALEPGAAMSGVTELTAATFAAAVPDAPRAHHTLVEFYAPYCGWSQKIAPEWKNLGASAKDSAELRIAKFDASAAGAEAVNSKYGVRGFPTIVLFKKDGTKRRYSGERTAAAWLQFVKEQVGLDIFLEEPKPPGAEIEGGTGEVAVLSPITWYEAVRRPVEEGARDVFVKFYAPWCGHCKQMAPAWRSVAKRYQGKNDILIAELDSDEHKHLARQMGVAGYPTLKWYPKGGKAVGEKDGELYEGPRTEKAMYAFAEERRRKAAAAK